MVPSLASHRRSAGTHETRDLISRAVMPDARSESALGRVRVSLARSAGRDTSFAATAATAATASAITTGDVLVPEAMSLTVVGTVHIVASLQALQERH